MRFFSDGRNSVHNQSCSGRLCVINYEQIRQNRRFAIPNSQLVSKLLTEEHKQKRLASALIYLTCHNEEDDDLLL